MPRSKKRHGLEAEPWAILPSALHRLLAWDRGEVTIEPGDPLVAQLPAADRQRAGAIAVIPVTGVIEHHSDWLMELFGGTAADTLAGEFRSAMADPDVRAIVLDIDSPGGTVSGITELAGEIRDARGGDKPIVAVANAMAASAAYWLASQADEIVVTPSAQIGSIGVYAMHQDISGALAQEGVDVTLVSAGPHKTEGNMFEPLSEEGRADLQSRVDETYRQFLADVAAGRRMTVEQVKADFGGGRVMTARSAVKAGMADRVESLGATLARLSKRRYQRGEAAAEAHHHIHAAEWTTAYINDLPDSAFACIDAGGKKDEDGKTTPRSLRHYPHHDASGKVDEEHLRAARSRVAQDATTSCGRDHLYETHKLPSDEARLNGNPGVLAQVPTVTVTAEPQPDDAPTFADELALVAGDIEALVERATTRAALRSSEGRPAYSTATERSLRMIRSAIDALLATEDPDASAAADDPPTPAAADDPPPVVPVMPSPPAAPPRTFRSREDWLQFVRNH